jgi:hypothetical protein
MTVTIGWRELLAALGGAAVAWPVVGRAQSQRCRSSDLRLPSVRLLIP